jgi:hypothetical protein
MYTDQVEDHDDDEVDASSGDGGEDAGVGSYPRWVLDQVEHGHNDNPVYHHSNDGGNDQGQLQQASI